MKVCVHGLWHLGSVTAACLAAAGLDVVGLDDDAATVQGLKAGTVVLRSQAGAIREGTEVRLGGAGGTGSPPPTAN